MNKAELISIVASKTLKSKKDVELIVDQFLEEITFTLGIHEEIKLSGFGNFSVKERAERVGTDPNNTNTRIVIPATYSISFKPSKIIKEVVKSNK